MEEEKKIALIWLRYDLRLHDNEMLNRAIAQNDEVLPVYCFDDRHYEMLTLGFRKTDIKRAIFTMDCLIDLRDRLQQKDSNLYTTFGKPEEVLPALARKLKAQKVYVQKEIAAEETDAEAAVEKALAEQGIELKLIWGRTLYHLEDLPMAIDEIPKKFKEFRKPLTAESEVRSLFEAPNKIPTVQLREWNTLPSLEELGYTTEERNQSYNIIVKGGETEALARLDYYTFDTDLIQNYKYTRNRSLGTEYSSLISPYLANGCLSPRLVYHKVKEYEEQVKKSRGTWWLIFELLWRDYFQFLGLRYGNLMFQKGGIYERDKAFNENRDLFDRWKMGQTGIPFVDAHIRQLLETGFMSNRGRVNCASFLARDYQVDWRWGAAWFESHLIDYDVCSNWLNWNTQAMEIWYTNPVWQGIKYDKNGEYVKTYLPELQNIMDARVQAPWMLEEAERAAIDYPEPVEIYKKWNWAMNKVKAALKEKVQKD